MENNESLNNNLENEGENEPSLENITVNHNDEIAHHQVPQNLLNEPLPESRRRRVNTAPQVHRFNGFINFNVNEDAINPQPDLNANNRFRRPNQQHRPNQERVAHNFVNLNIVERIPENQRLPLLNEDDLPDHEPGPNQPVIPGNLHVHVEQQPNQERLGQAEQPVPEEPLRVPRRTLNGLIIQPSFMSRVVPNFVNLNIAERIPNYQHLPIPDEVGLPENEPGPNQLELGSDGEETENSNYSSDND